MTAEPKTLEDYQELKKKTLEQMNNPLIRLGVYLALSERLEKVDIKIEELKSELL